MIKNILLVAAGGGIGSVARYMLYVYSGVQVFPYATLLINIAGSFLLGILMALGAKAAGLAEGYKLFFAVGLCGGFTTFSAFSFENVTLLQNGKYNLFFVYVLSSIVAGLLATWLGFKLINH